MTEHVDPEKIENIVGAERHPTRHLGRAVTTEQVVYILHSALCKAKRDDLRECSYSRALDLGIALRRWAGHEDRAVVLGLDRDGLVPLRDAPYPPTEGDDRADT